MRIRISQKEPEDLLKDRTEAEPLTFVFHTHSTGEVLLEIHRFPSLNSVGRLRVGISLDGGPVQIVESVSNDEWRGNWKENVLNNVDRLYFKLVIPVSSDAAGERQAGGQWKAESEQQHTAEQNQAGMHRLHVWAIDRYFAFSRMVIYTKPRKENSLAGIRGAQALPKEQDLTMWCNAFYAQGNQEDIRPIPPRPVFYAVRGNDRDSLTVTCREEQVECFGRTVTPDWYLEQGNHIFAETDGAIRIDAASVLAQSNDAWTQETEKSEQAGQQARGLWRHCSSESFGRSGLAMYIRTCHSDHLTEKTPELCWKPETAPSLNYRIHCSGGTYTLWMLSKFNVREEGFFGIGIDGKQIPAEKLYGNGGLWRYEAEQVYRWVPAATIPLARGEHTLHIYALASGMRYDRFYLTKGEEQPPMDTAW